VLLLKVKTAFQEKIWKMNFFPQLKSKSGLARALFLLGAPVMIVGAILPWIGMWWSDDPSWRMIAASGFTMTAGWVLSWRANEWQVRLEQESLNQKTWLVSRS